MTVTSQSPPLVVLALFGKVAGPDVQLLQREGDRYLERGAQLTLELDSVQFIDEAGLALLQQWDDQDVVRRGGSTFLQALLAAEGLESG